MLSHKQHYTIPPYNVPFARETAGDSDFDMGTSNQRNSHLHWQAMSSNVLYFDTVIQSLSINYSRLGFMSDTR